MGNDIQKGTTYATGGIGGQGSITSANLNAHVDDAIIKPTFVTTKAARAPGVFTDQILLESGGALYKMLLSTLRDLLVTPGSIIQTVYAEYTANANLTTVMPSDDTIPQSTEGTQIISLSITPRFATSVILLTFHGAGAVLNGSPGLTMVSALFRDSGANALVASNTDPSALGFMTRINLIYQDAPATTSAVSYTVRVGPGVTNTLRLNGYATGRILGGAMRSTLTAMEIKV